MKRGEVWWADSPQAGRRPHLILSRNTAIDVMQRVLVVPATRTVRGGPAELALGPDDGMPSECVLTFDNVTNLDKSTFLQHICSLGVAQMDEVCRVLARATGCRPW